MLLTAGQMHEGQRTVTLCYNPSASFRIYLASGLTQPFQLIQDKSTPTFSSCSSIAAVHIESVGLAIGLKSNFDLFVAYLTSW
jgi:hypothetical protein